MVIIDTVINTLFGGLTLDPAGMHCPLWDDAFVSSLLMYFMLLLICNLCCEALLNTGGRAGTIVRFDDDDDGGMAVTLRSKIKVQGHRATNGWAHGLCCLMPV